MTTQEVRCYGHVFDPAHQNGSHGMGHDGWPAHTWSGRWHHAGQGCRHCRNPFDNGDRYICVEGGAMHAACVADLDDSILPPPGDTEAGGGRG